MMGGFFKGWRRKAGCILLALALALEAICLRSRVWMDIVTVRCGSSMYHLTSSGLRVSWSKSFDAPPLEGFPLWWWSDQNSTAPLLEPMEGEVSFDTTYWTLPYWSFIVPLTLISICLLLPKPRTTPREHANA